MDFDRAHDSFIKQHTAARTGERRGRLARGHGHAETMFLRNVWWPLQGSFEDLHPEYEVMDWRGRSYYADLAWLPDYAKLLFEIKGFAAHVRDMDRHKYCNELNRETFLYAMGYQVISFAYDDVEQRPDICITLLRMVLGRHRSTQAPTVRALLTEKEIIILAMEKGGSVRPVDVEQHFGIDHRTAVTMLRKVCSKGWLQPSYRGKGQRIVRYELVRGVLERL